MPPELLGDPLELPRMMLNNNLFVAGIYASALVAAAALIGLAVIVRGRR